MARVCSTMASLRSCFVCPVFGNVCEMPKNVLPTYETIMKQYLWCSTIQVTENKKLTNLVTITSEKIAFEVENIWKSASLPVIDHRAIRKKIKEYHTKYRNLMKPYKDRKTDANYCAKLKDFLNNSKRLFDICPCKCQSFDECICEKNRKVPLLEQGFLLDQRGDRKMFIGGVDVVETKKQCLSKQRKLMAQEYREKYRSINSQALSSVSVSPSRYLIL